MIPKFAEKHAHESLITPAKLLLHRKEHGRLPQAAPPKTVIICYKSKFIKALLEKEKTTQCDGCFSKLYFFENHPEVAIGDFEFGAPAVAAKMEELISWGVKRFISIGTAGSLQAKLGIGDIVLCDRAVRDEGTSHHYIPSSKYIHAPRRMTNQLQAILKQQGIPHLVGSSWTTDSFYRQTAQEVLHYRQEGVLSVEMEASALFAVAHYHKVDCGALFVIGDTHADLNWKPHLEDVRILEGLDKLLQVAVLGASEK